METRRHTRVHPSDVFAVLADGWTYPSWVVGASRMRAVDDAWPAAGAKLHHSVGVWPLLLNDETEVLECEPDHRIKLQAKGWPAGEATVEILLLPVPTGGTLMIMRERVTRGPGRLVPPTVQSPILGWRNRESLRRLAFLAEGHARTPRTAGQSAAAEPSEVTAESS
jgi:uncharacterized protein YndB with AHSA1/START domain